MGFSSSTFGGYLVREFVGHWCESHVGEFMGLFVSFGFVVGCDDQIWSLRNCRHACVSMCSNRKYARMQACCRDKRDQNQRQKCELLNPFFQLI